MARIFLSDVVGQLPAMSSPWGSLLGSVGGTVGGVIPFSPVPASAEPSIPENVASESVVGDRRKMVLVAVSALVIVGVSTITAVALSADPDFSQTADEQTVPIDGLTIFAMFFVAAFAVERLLEPISKLVLPRTSLTDDLDLAREEAAAIGRDLLGAMAAQRSIEMQVHSANSRSLFADSPSRSSATGATMSQVEEQGRDGEERRAELAVDSSRSQERVTHLRSLVKRQLDQAARAVVALEDRIAIRTVLFWALATSIAVFASASLDLYFFRTIGATSTARWLEVLATGLTIGAGTKPLHDVINMITKKPQ